LITARLFEANDFRLARKQGRIGHTIHNDMPNAVNKQKQRK